ncbi:MAG TPA: hypothetical protein VFZ03_11740 [Dongiaceae bacterium]
MAHYIGVLVPRGTGGWRALFPDIPACEVKADSLDLAVLRATSALTECVARQYGDILPAPRELGEIKADERWAADHAIDWSKAVVVMVPVRGGPQG